MQVAWLYTITVSTVFGGLVGVTQRLMGVPGDLPDTVANVHKRGYIPIKQAPSMFICSSFSISAGERSWLNGAMHSSTFYIL